MLIKEYQLLPPFKGRKKIIELEVAGQKINLPYEPGVLFPLEMLSIEDASHPILQSFFVASINDVERSRSAAVVKVKISHLAFDEGVVIIQKTLNETKALLRIDANRGLNEEQLKILTKMIPDDRLDYFEEPLPSIKQALTITRKLAIDESLSTDGWQTLLEHPHIVAAVIKPYRVFWRPIVDVCKKLQKRVVLSSTLEDSKPILKLAAHLQLFDEHVGIDVERFKTDCFICPVAKADPSKVAFILDNQPLTYGIFNNQIQTHTSNLSFDQKSTYEKILHIFSILRRGYTLDFNEIISEPLGNIETIPSSAKIMLTTSGTTGNPKKILWNFDVFSANILEQMHQLRHLKGKTTRLDLGLHRMGGFSALMRPILTEGIINLDQDILVDYVSLVATQIVKSAQQNVPLNTRCVLLGGSKPSSNTLSILERQAISYHLLYSTTELGTCIIDGVPIDGVEVKIENDQELKIKKKAKADNISTDASGFFATQDTAESLDGKIKITGRKDRVIISGAEKISLNYIEQTLQKIFPEAHFFAFGIDDPIWGEALCVAFQSIIPLQSDAILQALRANYPRYMVPKKVFPINDHHIEKPPLDFLKSMANTFSENPQLIH